MEKEKKEILIGNATTIANTIFLAIAGLIIGVLASYGLKLPIDQTTLAGIIGLIVTTIFGYYNAKYHNTYFEDDTLKIDASNLTEAQITAINGFVKETTELNTINIAGKTFNRYNDSQIFDNDVPLLNQKYTVNNNNDDKGV